MRVVPQHARVWQSHLPLILLVGVLVVVFALQAILGPGFYGRFMTVPLEVGESVQELKEGRFSMEGAAALATLSTYEFLHGSAEHLLFNLIFLWMFAALALELLGARWMFLIFFVTGIGGSVCHVLLNSGDPTPLLGASGGVMGFEGAYLALAVRWRLPDPHVWPISRPVPPSNLVIFALIGVAGDSLGIVSSVGSNVAYGAHLGGFISGIFLTGFLAPRPKGANPR